MEILIMTNRTLDHQKGKGHGIEVHQLLIGKTLEETTVWMRMLKTWIETKKESTGIEKEIEGMI